MSADADSSLTRHRSFVRFWCARTFTNGAFMMQGVAVGWQIYALTNDPLDLATSVSIVHEDDLVAASGRSVERIWEGANGEGATDAEF